jgi:hypothetical protein
MRMELRGRLIRKPRCKPAVEAREATGEEVRLALAARARKLLGESVALGEWQLQSY